MSEPTAWEVRQRLEQTLASMEKLGRDLSHAILDDQQVWAAALATQYLTAARLVARLRKQLELEAVV